MSVFGSIKNAIFGHHDQVAAAPPPAAAAATAPAATPAAPAPAEHKQLSEDAINAVLEQNATARGEQLNYKSSIVDLMKALGLDSSLENRKKLATELGYTGDMNDSATMNIWLHEKTMARLTGG